MPFARLANVLLLSLVLPACEPAPQWNGTDVSGVLPDLAFELVDSGGDTVTADAFQGKTTLLFFGFTNCPGPCPATLAQIGLALDAMGPDADAVQVLMVSVDPDRDTPAALQRFERSFGPWLHGLTGSDGQLQNLRETYKVFAERQQADSKGNYDVAHSIGVFAFDVRGRCRLLLANVADTDAVVSDLRHLVAGA